MAGNKLTFRARVTASTIIEVIVAMIVILVVFGIAMMIFTNVTRLSLSSKKLTTQALLNETLFKAEQTRENTNETLNIEDFVIKQEITDFENEPLLSVITLTAFDKNGEQLARLKKVIVNHDEK